MRMRVLWMAVFLLAVSPFSLSASAVEVTVDGAVRHQTLEGFGTCLVAWVGAFLHEKDGDLTIVALNPTDQEQTLNLTFRGFRSVPLLKAYRTSASESLQEAGELAIRDNKAAFQMTAQSIVTFSGRIGR